MDFAVGGEWGWETTSSLSGVGALWKNPGDGFDTGCTTYMDLQTCLDVESGPDLMFSVDSSP